MDARFHRRKESKNTWLTCQHGMSIYIRETGPGFKKGDLNRTKFDEQAERMEKLRAAIHEFDRFQHLMYAGRAYMIMMI